MSRTANDLLHGTLDVLVLKTLSWRPMHGYDITTWIERNSGQELDIVDATLYKALHRLEASGAVTAAVSACRSMERRPSSVKAPATCWEDSSICPRTA